MLIQYLENDHKRIDEYLHRAAAHPDETAMTAYSQFRGGLLRHIGIGENLLFPTLLQTLEGQPLPDITQIKLDHAALVALLVPPPTRSIIAALRAILDKHNMLEERAGGIYQFFKRIPGVTMDVLLQNVRSSPAVPMLPQKSTPNILNATRRALARAGYNLADYEND